MTTATCIILALNSLWCNLIFDTRYDDNAIESVSPFYIPDGDPSGKVVRITGNYAKGMMSTYSAWWERVMYNYDSSADNIWNDYALTNMAFKGTVGASVLAHGDYFIDGAKPLEDSQLATVAFRDNGPDPSWGSTTNRVVSSLTRILDFEWFKRLFSDAKSLQNQDDISCSKMLDTEYWGEHDYQDMGLTGWLEHPKAMGWKWWEHLWPVAHATGSAAGANNPIAPSGVSRRTLDTLVERSLYEANFWIDPDDQTPHVQDPMGLDLYNDMYTTFVTNRCWKFIVGGPGPRVDFFQQSAVNRLINFYDTSYVAQDDMAPLLPWRRTFYDSNCSTGCTYIANKDEYSTNDLYTIDWSIYPYQLKMLPYNDYAYNHSTNWSGDSSIDWSSSQRASNCVFAAKFTGDSCSMSVAPEVPLFANITWTILTNAMEHLVPGGVVPESEARLVVKTDGFRTWPAWHFTAENITTNEYIANLDFFFPTSFPQTVVYNFEFKNTGKIASSELINPEDDDAPPSTAEIITPAITRPTTNAFNMGLVKSAVASSMESKTWDVYNARSTTWDYWPGATGLVEPHGFAGQRRIRVSGASNGCDSHDELVSAMVAKMSTLKTDLATDGDVVPSAFLADARATIPVCGYNEVLEDFFSTKLPALTGGGNPPFELMWQDFLKPSGQGFVRIARGYDPDGFWIEGHEVFPGGSLIAAELATGLKDGSALLESACDETEAYNNDLHLFYSGAVIDFMTRIRWNYFNLK